MTGNYLCFKRNVLFHVLRHSSVSANQSSFAYCMELVRKHDYENFLCTLLLSRETRATAFAIRAFNVEIAQIRDQVKDYKIGEMRLRFWIDALDNTYNGRPPKSPAMLGLHMVLQKHSLSKHYFKRLISIRSEKLLDASFKDISSIEKYAEYSCSSVYYLLLEAHDIANVNADHAASHLGKAHGIINLIRSIPYNASRRVNMLPQDILMKHGVSTEAVLQCQTSKELQNVIFEIATHGKQHLDTAISLKSKVKKQASMIFLPIVCVEKYLKELQKADFNIFDAKLQRRDNLLPLHLYWKSWTY